MAIMIHRRAALLGLMAASAAVRQTAVAQELVQRKEPKKVRSVIPGIDHVLVREVTYLPGGRTSRVMPHTMICECTAGTLDVSQDTMTHPVGTGEMWTCHKGMTEIVANKGSAPAVMRVIELVPA